MGGWGPCRIFWEVRRIFFILILWGDPANLRNREVWTREKRGTTYTADKTSKRAHFANAVCYKIPSENFRRFIGLRDLEFSQRCSCLLGCDDLSLGELTTRWLARSWSVKCGQTEVQATMVKPIATCLQILLRIRIKKDKNIIAVFKYLSFAQIVYIITKGCERSKVLVSSFHFLTFSF
jgi:hypothetical protein